MPKDEKILKKIDKLLKMYGINDNERQNVLNDVQDAKYDDEEESVETPTEETEVEEKEENLEPTEEIETESKGDEVEEEKVEEEPQEEIEQVEEQPLEQEPVEQAEGEELPQEEVANDSEEIGGAELPTEQEEQLPEFNAQESIEELKKTNEGLAARLASLEDIVSKLGVNTEDDQTLGASPAGNPIDESNESMFDQINRKRVGY